MKRPVIGIVPLVDIQRESYWMLPGYMDGVAEAGGLPLMLPLTDDEKQIDQLTELCNGFLFTGGQDVDPSIYGEEKDAACGECCQQRDAMEAKLLHAALRHDKPIFGICRGIQFINAALGGTLYQDLPSQHPSEIEHHQHPPYDVPVHTVTPIPSTPLAALLGDGAIAVNSYHHQAVKELAPGWSAMAAAADGIVEAAYMPGRRFVWAVQWHPEFSFRVDENSRKLFHTFVQCSCTVKYHKKIMSN